MCGCNMASQVVPIAVQRLVVYSSCSVCSCAKMLKVFHSVARMGSYY